MTKMGGKEQTTHAFLQFRKFKGMFHKRFLKYQMSQNNTVLQCKTLRIHPSDKVRKAETMFANY